MTWKVGTIYTEDLSSVQASDCLVEKVGEGVVGYMNESSTYVPFDKSAKWWEIWGGKIFAIDADCNVNEDGTKVVVDGFTLSVEGPPVKRVVTVGCKKKHYRDDVLSYASYRALKVNGSNLKLDKPVYLSHDITIVVMAKMNDLTVFLSKEGDIDTWIAAYGTGGSRDLAYQEQATWRLKYTYPVTLIPGELKAREGWDFIDSAVITGNKEEGPLTFYTQDYTGPVTSNRIAESYSTTTPHDMMGYSEEKFRVSAEIIAFGVFNKKLKPYQVEYLLQEIERQFKVEVEKKWENTSASFLPFNISLSQQLATTLPYYRLPAPQSLSFSPSILSKNPYIEEYMDIEDHVYEEGVPISTTLFLIERLTGKLIATTNSNKEGWFCFKHVDKSKDYVVIASDKKYQFNSIIKDYING